MFNDRRQLFRTGKFLVLQYQTAIHNGVICTGILKDISEQGLSMEIQNLNFSTGDILELNIKSLCGDIEIALSGSVIWTKHSWYKYIAGIRLMNMTDDLRTNIQRLIQSTDKVVIEECLQETESAENCAPVNDSEQCTADIAESSAGQSPLVMDGNNDRPESECKGRTDIAASGAVDYSGCAYTHNPYADTLQHADYGACTNSIWTGIKSKAWVYVPVLTVIVIILFIAVPGLINKFEVTDGLSPENAGHVSKIVRQDPDVNKASPVSPVMSSDEKSLSVPLVMNERDTALADIATDLSGAENVADNSLKVSRDDMTKDMLKGKNISDDNAALSVSGKGGNLAGDYVRKQSFTSLIKEINETLHSINTMDMNDRPDHNEQKGTFSVSQPSQHEAVIKDEPEKKIEVLKAFSDRSSMKEETVHALKAPAGGDMESAPEKPEDIGTLPNVVRKDVSANRPSESHTQADKQIVALLSTKNQVSAEKTESPDKSMEEVHEGRTLLLDAKGLKGRKTRSHIVQPRTEPAGKRRVTALVVPPQTVQTHAKTGRKRVPPVALVLSKGDKKVIGDSSVLGKKRGLDIGLFKKWTYIGSPSDGISLYTDAGTAAGAIHGTVKFTLRTSTGSRDYLDLVEINCLNGKIRVLGPASNGSPILSGYSGQWSALSAEDAMIYDFTCSKQAGILKRPKGSLR